MNTDQPKPATGNVINERLFVPHETEPEPEPKPATGEEVIIVNGKPIKVSDIIDTMEDEYRERHGLPDPEE